MEGGYNERVVAGTWIRFFKFEIVEFLLSYSYKSEIPFDILLGQYADVSVQVNWIWRSLA